MSGSILMLVYFCLIMDQEVEAYLDVVLQAQDLLLKANATNLDTLASYGNTVLGKTEKLVSTLVKPTDTFYSVNISRNGLGKWFHTNIKLCLYFSL